MLRAAALASHPDGRAPLTPIPAVAPEAEAFVESVLLATITMNPMSTASNWPTEKLAALRLGRRLVTEVPASRPGRRAFVDITPSLSAPDAQARDEGWARSDSGRSFLLEHWEYEADRIEGFDYDIGAELVQTASAANEPDLDIVLKAWQLPPDRFVHPWASEDPK